MLKLAALASNPANKDDAIDRSVYQAYAKMTGMDVDVAAEDLYKQYEVGIPGGWGSRPANDSDPDPRALHPIKTRPGLEPHNPSPCQRCESRSVRGAKRLLSAPLVPRLGRSVGVPCGEPNDSKSIGWLSGAGPPLVWTYNSSSSTMASTRSSSARWPITSRKRPARGSALPRESSL